MTTENPSYRENAKPKQPLFFICISYTKDGRHYCLNKWVRGRDSFTALKSLLKSSNIEDSQVWSQDVISRVDFDEKENEIE